jgi:hypothetical protein
MQTIEVEFDGSERMLLDALELKATRSGPHQLPFVP